MKVFKILEEKTIRNIDGFSVGISKDFLPTVEYIEKMFNRFNYRYFNNELFLEIPKDIKGTLLENLFPEKIDIEVKPYSGSLGECIIAVYKHKDNDNFFLSVVEKLVINNRYLRSEKNYCEILLHEMIHIWESQILNKGNTITHSKTFLQKREEINKAGWNILIKETEENLKERGEMNIQELKDNFRLLIYKRNNNIGSYLILEKELLDIASMFSYNNFILEVYEILEDNSLLDSPILNKETSIDTLTLRLTSLEEVDSLVKNKKIKLNRMIPPLNSLNESKRKNKPIQSLQYLNNGKTIVYPPYELEGGLIVTRMVIRD